MKFFKEKKSLTRKFLMYMLLIGLLPLLFFGVLSIMSTNSVLKNETISFYQQLAEQRKQYIELVMSDIESLVANISGIDDIKDALVRNPLDTSYSRLSTQAKIGYILSGYTNLKGLISIDIFSHYGTHYHVGETLNATNIDIDLKQRLETEAKASNEFVYWYGIDNNINKNSKYPMAITATKILRTNVGKGSDDNSEGLLVISYSPEVFSEVFSKTQNKAAYSLVMDAKKRIIIHPDSNYIGKTISADIESRLMKNEGFFQQNIDGDQTLVIYSKTQKGGWIVGNFILLGKIYDKNWIITAFFAGLLLISVLAIGAIGLMVSNNVVLPIKKVTDTFRSLKKGEMENIERFNIKSGDEIGELGNLFNSFIDAREDITVQKKLERQLNKQNAELNEALERLKATQTQMIQQEKLAGIGQLAAGVAHEINNPLGFVSCNFGIIHKYVFRYEKILDEVKELRATGSDSSEEIKKTSNLEHLWKENKIDRIRKDMLDVLGDTQEGLDRISAIVTGLKSFSRINQHEEKMMFNFNEGIKTTLLVANNELKYNCGVEFEAGNIPDIQANGGQINQVILNVLINAVHAIKMKHGDQKGEIKIKTFADEKSVYCSIFDNGCGMSEDVKKRVFEPFFTTKPVGQGTGLGMGISYDIIINKHGGMIDVDSELGKGTCICISLPIISDKIFQMGGRI